jgi:hypothetical protein
VREANYSAFCFIKIKAAELQNNSALPAECKSREFDKKNRGPQSQEVRVTGFSRDINL